MLIASALVLPVFYLEGSSISSPWMQVGIALNWASWLVFLTEAMVMIRVGGWSWVKSNPLPVVVTVLTPPFAPPGLAILRLLRFLRLLRLVPGIRVARRLFSLEGVKFAGFVAVVTIVVGGITFSRVEDSQGLDTLDGIWWAVTTVTTVGYGDLSPSTTTGRALAAVIMFVGIGFVALVTAFIAERFIADKTDAVSDTEDAILREIRKLDDRLSRIETGLAKDRSKDK